MDKSILNLMLSNVEGSSEDPISETNSVCDGFEFMGINECKENCYRKIKPILQQAAQTIKLKDRQINNLINLALKNYPESKNLLQTESSEANKEEINVLTIVSNNENQVKDENGKSPEVTNPETDNHLDEKDVIIKLYQTKIKQLEDEIKTMSKKLKGRVDKYPNKMVFRTNFDVPILCTIENDVAGPGWIVIQRYEMCEGELKEIILLGSKFLHDLMKDQLYELYIHVVNEDGSTSYAHYDNFKIDPNSQTITSLGSLKTSMEISGNFIGKPHADIYKYFGHKSIKFQLMIRQKLNLFLQQVVDDKN
ncbi:uncharacterized protein LOC111519022 [Drosophila willistoni]|uniref:uncharacterized protein LOC111519022 n=1 Tax=Drosophila willistoni TaxID=7260 RepID=UPI000C26D9E7|nr:uncharacterized protein LOC111519022 [Drosophila willistoni]